jgi:hypothetical protein
VLLDDGVHQGDDQAGDDEVALYCAYGARRRRGLRRRDGRATNPLAPAHGIVATVLVFTTTDCPIANRYAPEIQRLAATYESRAVRFTLVYPVPGDTPEIVKAHLEKFGYHLAAVRDAGQELVRRAGAKVTPEAVVFDARGRVVYRGRIDDRYVDFGLDRPEPTSRDLERAIQDLLAGRPVAVPSTQAVGCILADLVK